MDYILKLWVLIRRSIDMITDCWPYKAAAAGLSTLICFLFGGSEIILLIVMVFVCLDTLTKWVAITKRYLIDQGIQPTTTALLCGFFYAWKPGYLSSTALKQCWGEKIFTYGTLIVFAGMTGKLPEILIAGTQLNKAIAGGIYAYIAMTELFSILENFQDMGNKKVAQLKQYFCTIVSKITGTSFSVTISNKEDKKNS
ncbi:phage holin family protein [Sporomusa termitida]|uniref:Bacteriophage holin family protein n=1 Tax=Sporomusa termitida TaxID=2377 RepID=A0A517DSB0_9FIRM|nr:phage holin family protein [Sporomusa termitida]QDR80244.1 hypothetical protein SPTER_15630 [Sporomusa termitida]